MNGEGSAMNLNSGDLLSFKEFPPVHGNQLNNSQTAQINVNSPQKSYDSKEETKDALQDLINDMSASARALGAQDQMQQTGESKEFTNGKLSHSFLSIDYYQQFFNVDTLMVIDRIVSSVIPRRAPSNYLKSHIGLNPDLYGPFWIAVTLIFSMAISGNIADYLQTASDDYKWKYNFHLVSYAATAIFTYACFVPIALWAILKWSLKPVDEDLETESSGYTPNILSLMCIYGYSLFIYIPISILCVIQISFLQWLLVITAALLSGSVLIFILTPALRYSKFPLFLAIGILILHFILAAGFLLYFFHAPSFTNTVKLVTEAPKKIAANISVTTA